VDILLPSFLLYLVGELALVGLLVFIGFTIFNIYRKPLPSRTFGLASKGSAWAIVTGAGDGIGKVFCIELARLGYNVLMISRTMSKVEALAKEIESKYGVSTKGIGADFGSSDKSFYNEISETVKSLNRVSILVNNVGINYEFPSKFLDQTPELDDQIIEVNIKSLLGMTRLVLPHMLKQKSGGIINLSSLAGRVPSPMLAVYSGTKAYIDFYSASLAREYQDQGISVLSIAPGLTVSNMSQARRPNLALGIVNPQPVVRAALANLGQRTRITGHPLHILIETVLRLLPGSISSKYIYGLHQGIRSKALAKRERENKNKTT